MAVAVVGNLDNEKNCVRGEPCLKSDEVRTDLFKQYRFQLTGPEADKIWR